MTGLAATVDLCRVWLMAPTIDWVPVETGERAQAGRGLRGAVGVDYIAMDWRAHGGNLFQQAAVKALNMPIGTFQRMNIGPQPPE